jgi:hypothetical protein
MALLPPLQGTLVSAGPSKGSAGCTSSLADRFCDRSGDPIMTPLCHYSIGYGLRGHSPEESLTATALSGGLPQPHGAGTSSGPKISLPSNTAQLQETPTGC